MDNYFRRVRTNGHAVHATIACANPDDEVKNGDTGMNNPSSMATRTAIKPLRILPASYWKVPNTVQKPMKKVRFDLPDQATEESKEMHLGNHPTYTMDPDQEKYIEVKGAFASSSRLRARDMFNCTLGNSNFTLSDPPKKRKLGQKWEKHDLDKSGGVDRGKEQG
ncbi:hypothetical protein RUND412_006439 [Rhizina undulata]